MTGWLWLTDEDTVPSGALASAALRRPDGRRSVLCAWPSETRPRPGARRVDAALVDPAGPATRAVLQWLPAGGEPLFDDPAVQHALRQLAAFPAGPVSTLTRDSTRYCGALQVLTDRTTVHGASALRALGPTPVCAVGAGLLAVRPRSLHGTQRVAGAPWPARG